MAIYLIADTHFYHQKVISYCDRPFASVEEMNTALVENWNRVVNSDDTVFHLGDVSFGDFTQTYEVIDKLAGSKILIRGNHDERRSDTWWIRTGFVAVHKSLLHDNFFLTHRPTKTEDGLINIHGHTHNSVTGLDDTKYKCVSVEMINYTPVELLRL